MYRTLCFGYKASKGGKQCTKTLRSGLHDGGNGAVDSARSWVSGSWAHPFHLVNGISGRTVKVSGLCDQMYNTGGGLNHPSGNFQSVAPVKKEKGDMKRCEINNRPASHRPLNPEKTRLEQRDHWSRNKFKSSLFPVTLV